MRATIILILSCLYYLDSPAQLTDGAMHFDGVDDRITIPGNSHYATGNGNITVEIWMKHDTLGFPGGYPILSNRGTMFNGFSIWTTPGFFTIILSGQQVIGGINNGTCFTHIAFVRENFDLRIYIGGSLINTSTSSMIDNLGSLSTLYIGYENSSAGFLRGAVKELRIWNTARTDAEISSHMNDTLNLSNAAGLVGYWRFDDTTQVVHDYSMYHNNGVRGSLGIAENNDAMPVNSFLVCGLPNVIPEYEKSFSLSENPSSKGWTLNRVNNNLKGQLIIYDVAGKQFFQKSFSESEAVAFGEQFPSGVYFVRVNTIAGMENFKLLKF